MTGNTRPESVGEQGNWNGLKKEIQEENYRGPMRISHGRGKSFWTYPRDHVHGQL